jgi:PBSX family phage terminase large subunit
MAETFDFKPFSRKQRQVLNWWTEGSPVNMYDGIIADGSIRSGKSLSMSLSFVMWAMHSHDEQNFAMCGKTVGALRRNVIQSLKLMLASRGYCVEDLRSRNLLYITGDGHRNTFYVFGGQDERSQDKIQGLTAAGVYFDEVALMPESFVNQAVGRNSVEGSKIWFNCNPEAPSHWFKEKWIDMAEEKNLLHLHFLMDDNLTLSEEKKEQYKRNFSGVFYDRYILGLWTLAEGIIYPMYKDAVQEAPKGSPEAYCVALDYGTYNAFAAHLWGKYGNVWHCMKEYYYSGRATGVPKSDDQYADDMERFLHEVPGIIDVIVDPSASSFITALRMRNKQKGTRYRVIPANNDVMNGIRDTQTAMATGLIKFSPDCKATAKEMGGYRWDDKEVDTPIKENDHACVTGETILMADKGAVKIADMVGTEGMVLSYNIESGAVEYKPYKDCRMTKRQAKILKITLDDGRTIRCTEDHPILTERGYVQAKYLKENDLIIDISDTKSTARGIRVESIEPDGIEDVYNLEVADNHNFVVDGIVLHNCDAVRYFVETKRIVIPKLAYRSPFG